MMSESLPEPRPTPETAPYWEATARRELVRHCCDACGASTQHPRVICSCGSRALSWTPCSGRARLHSYIIVHKPEPAFTADAPFVLGIVQLEGGALMTTRIVDVDPVPESLHLDMPLQLRWLPRGALNLPVFAPTGEPA